jgi:hypothetical protein
VYVERLCSSQWINPIEVHQVYVQGSTGRLQRPIFLELNFIFIERVSNIAFGERCQSRGLACDVVTDDVSQLFIQRRSDAVLADQQENMVPLVVVQRVRSWLGVDSSSGSLETPDYFLGGDTVETLEGRV